MIKFIHLTWIEGCSWDGRPRQTTRCTRYGKAETDYPETEGEDLCRETDGLDGCPREGRRMSPRRKTDVPKKEDRCRRGGTQRRFPWDGGQRQTSSRPKAKMDGPYVCPWVGRPKRMAETDISDTEVQDGEYKSMCFCYKLLYASVRRAGERQMWKGGSFRITSHSVSSDRQAMHSCKCE